MVYFQHQWINATPPEKWASYARPPDHPSGDNIIEAWHARMKGGNDGEFVYSLFHQNYCHRIYLFQKLQSGYRPNVCIGLIFCKIPLNEKNI